MTEKKGVYQKLKDAGLIGFMKTECHIYGCNDLETSCKDCGKVVNTAHYDSQWISVEVKMPVQFQHILISDTLNISTGYFQDGTFVGVENDIKHITHWMPLPLPPKAT